MYLVSDLPLAIQQTDLVIYDQVKDPTSVVGCRLSYKNICACFDLCRVIGLACLG